MKLADEQRDWVSRRSQLLAWAQEDGIARSPSVGTLPAVAERLLDLRAVSTGDGLIDDHLAKAFDVAAGSTLDDWLRESFFEQYCDLFVRRRFLRDTRNRCKRLGLHALGGTQLLEIVEGLGGFCFATR